MYYELEKGKWFILETSLVFYNTVCKELTFDQMFEKTVEFIKKEPTACYRLSIGTDSQVHATVTKFVTAIHIHRVGKGAIGFLKTHMVNRKIESIREKISLETILSQEVAFLYTEERLLCIENLLLPFLNEGADFQFEIHLDIGTNGMTKDLIKEMTGRIEAMGVEAKIKPESYAAFSYANRFTK